MKMKIWVLSSVTVLLSLAFSGCYVHRPYDPYYNDRYRKEYKHKHKHRHHHDRDYDRDDDHYRRSY